MALATPFHELLHAIILIGIAGWNRVVFPCKTCLRNTVFSLVSSQFRIRHAIPEDATVIGWQRARMFQDMGLVLDELFESYRTKALDRLRKALASGDYVGWLASETNAAENIIAGAGVVTRVVPPFPHRHKNGEITISGGRQGVIVNVFTEREWRRIGLRSFS